MNREEGTLSAFVVVLVTALMLVAGLVLDGGRMIAARREVQDIAQNAARAGANAVSIAGVRAGATAVDAGRAQAAAHAYLGRVGHTGTVRVTGDLVQVEVSQSVPMLLLSIGGVGPRTVQGVEQARIVRGVDGPET
jgi:Flp pilus assembly protein TadG